MLNINLVSKMKKDMKVRLVKGYLTGLEETVNLVEDKAKKYAPKDTGLLKTLITGYVKKNIGYILSKASYSSFQEFGTYKMSAANGGRGYMKPAVEDAKKMINAIFGKAIRNSLRRH